MISKKQIALIHVAKRDLGFDDDIYRAVLRRFGGVDSSADLDPFGFERIMNYFTALGFRSDWTKRTYGNRRGMASPAQVDLIRSLWAEYVGEPCRDNDDRLNTWLAKSFRVSALRFVDRTTAAKAITGLKRMVARKRPSTAA